MSTALATLAIVLAIVLRSVWPATTDTPAAVCSVVPGPSGAAGIAGASAYDVWIALGNTGTQKDFLASLVGKRGKRGFTGSDGLTPPTAEIGQPGASAYQLWLDAGNSGTEQDFLDSLTGAAGADGIPGQTGMTGAAGLSAYELWKLEGNGGSVSDFLDSLRGAVGEQGIQGIQGIPGVKGEPGVCTVGSTGPEGPQGSAGPAGPAGPTGEPGPMGSPGPQGSAGPKGDKGDTGLTGPAGTSGLGDSGSFWDTTTQGFDGLVSRTANEAHPVYLGEADTSNNQGVSVIRCLGDETKPAGYPVNPKSCITFTHPGVYNIAFSAQLQRSSGGSPDVFSLWLRKNGSDVPASNTDITLSSNGQKAVAAWNFFAPVTCNGTCTTYQLMWSASESNSNLWFGPAQSGPIRPSIPSVILTVNQVK